MRNIFLSFLLMISLSNFVCSQDKPRIAVLPFKAIGVSKVETMTASTLFETSMVQTDMFVVIEQNQIKEILKAQAYTLSGCTDEKCAVEIGKLLAAEQIVLGSFSKVGSSYILTAKIIDVTHGRNIRADKVSFSKMDDLSKYVDLLAYKLAGLTYNEGGTDTIVKSFGELFISTEPSGADIYVNGIKKGKSPDVVSKVPLGKIFVEARDGNLYGSMSVTVDSEEMKEITIPMKKMTGNIFIRCDDKDVNVFLDGKDLGELNTGLFKDLSVGSHKLEIKGVDTYWTKDIQLKEGSTVKVKAYPVPVGKLVYSLPEGALAEFRGPNTYGTGGKTDGTIENMAAGDYSVTVSGENYETLEDVITVEKGRIINFSPNVVYTKRYINQNKEQEWKKYQDQLESFTDRYSLLTLSSLPYFKSDIDVFYKQLKGSGFSFPDIERKTVELKEKVSDKKIELENAKKRGDLESRLADLNSQYEEASKRYKKKNMIRYTVGTVGIGSIAGSGISWYLGSKAYDSYNNAVTTVDAEKYRDESQMYDAVKISTAGAGIVFSSLFFIIKPSVELKNRIKTLKNSIGNLEEQLKNMEVEL